MKDQLHTAKDTLSRIAAVFLILWFIAAVTDLMGAYEYEAEFLMLAVVFYLLSRVPTAFRKHYSTRKKIRKAFSNVGWALIGLWIAFKILRWIGWFGPMDIGIDIDYLLVGGILLVLVGYIVKSPRSILYAVGGVSLLFWVLIKVFDIFEQYADIALVVGLVAIGAGYILGGFRKPPSFFVEIEEDEEVEPEISEEISVTEEDISISRGKTRVKINKGSLFVPVTAEKEVGGIYFGEGSYQVDAKVKLYSDVYRGVTLVSGNEWNSVRNDQKVSPADEQAFENIGLKKEEVLELARLQVKGKLTDKVRKRLKQTSVDLPFIKIRETPHGEYVKVGPIEFAETPDREHVRIGPWEFKETGYRRRFTREGLFIQIRSKDEDITIVTNGKTVFTKGDTHITVNDRVAIRGDDTDLVMDKDKKVLRSRNIKLICKEDKRILRSDGFELSVKEDKCRIKKNGKSTVITDKDTLEEIRTEIDAVADELIKEVLDRGELKELDALIKRFEKEL